VPLCKTDRSTLVISAGYTNALETAKALAKNLDYLHLVDDKKANQWLGQEFDAVIFEMYEGFSANAFGAITGIIRCGGYLLILKPESWQDDSLFLQHFSHCLNSSDHVSFISPALQNVSALPVPKKQNHSRIYATEDQKRAVSSIIHVIKGHRRRPLVITSDRGRGKSAALGIAAAQLYHQNVSNIIICAPSKNTAAIIFKHAKQCAPKCQLQFYSPDELQHKKPKADLLLIDEAAAIPIPLLTSFLKRYSRIVFATTQYGYEGSGRGFAINFRKTLDELTPSWNHCKLKTPIRWGKNDPLEQFVFDALLLNAEQAQDKQLNNFRLLDCTFVKQDKNELLGKPAVLEETFGLLVNAHYQTKPSDFKQMLDDDAMSIYTLSFNHYIVAVVLVVKEGGIDTETASEIFNGNRRLKGNLVAQSLAANVGIETAPCLQGQRIIRIAVHPSLQRQGVGTHVLKKLSSEITTDYLSASFGATESLIPFWEKCGYTSVYLSMKRDASSGTHSVIMLNAQSERAEELLHEATTQFKHHFPHLLSDPFKALEAEVSLALFTVHQSQVLTKSEESILNAFANEQRGYENSLYPIWNKVCQCLTKTTSLSYQEKKILLYKVLQKKSWEEVVSCLGGHVSGKKDALRLLRQAITKMI